MGGQEASCARVAMPDMCWNQNLRLRADFSGLVCNNKDLFWFSMAVWDVHFPIAGVGYPLTTIGFSIHIRWNIHLLLRRIFDRSSLPWNGLVQVCDGGWLATAGRPAGTIPALEGMGFMGMYVYRYMWIDICI